MSGFPRVVAHGIGAVQDLPVPQWLFYWGAGSVLVVSFVLLGGLWRRPLLAGHGGAQVPVAISRTMLGPMKRAVQAASVLLLGVVWIAATVGNEDPFSNLAPTWVYVALWLGVPALSVLGGNVWSALSPWRALADATVWGIERTGREARPLSVYPERLGRWPAAGALLAFAFLELAYAEPASPRSLAVAIAAYSYYALAGMAAFGRDTWERHGEGFAVLFRLVGRLSPLEARDGRLSIRWPLTGLAAAEHERGTVAVLAVALGSVLFDGWSRASLWQDTLAALEGPYVADMPAVAEAVTTGANAAAVVIGSMVIGLAYLAACATATGLARTRLVLAPELVCSLVPIAVAYIAAHYFSLAIVQGQFLLPLLSDPLGRGWDVLGVSGFEPNLAPLSPNTVWYAQVGALVVGHVAGLMVAHDRAVALLPDRRAALRSQLPMLGLMVLYTVGGLWVLSRG